MTGRISPIEIPIWSVDELNYIASVGFDLLNYRIAESVAQRFANEAIGSPHLMQDFCRGICKRLDLQFSNEDRFFEPSSMHVEAVFKDVAETIGRPIFEKLAREIALTGRALAP